MTSDKIRSIERDKTERESGREREACVTSDKIRSIERDTTESGREREACVTSDLSRGGGRQIVLSEV